MFTRPTVKTLQESISALVKSLGYEISSRGNFTADKVELKLTIRRPLSPKELANRAKSLTKLGIGTKFAFKNRCYQVTRINHRASKFRYEAKEVGSFPWPKTYKFTQDAVLSGMIEF